MNRKESKKKDIWAIILAGGESKRMKSPKMLLPFHDKTIIEKVIGNVIASEVDNIMVVLGAFHDEILYVIKEMPVLTCYNENYKEGMLSSVKCGFRNLPDKIEAVLVFQGDQPMISSGIINKILHSYQYSDKGLVMPVFQNKRGHPLLIDQKYVNEVEKLSNEEGLRSLAEEHSTDVLEVSVNNPEILRDIDTQEDYIRELNQTK
jgi:CTP:molybdopterin cytidylyltransferase MocA